MKTLRLTPFLILVACAAPKASVVEEPKKKTTESAPAVAQEPVMPKSDEAEQLRLPSDLLEKLPETNQFQATNPNLPNGRLNDGAAVIAKPPAEPSR